MSRTQVNYNPSQEPVQVNARPDIQTVQARNDPNSSMAYQLASAFGAAGPQLDKFAEAQYKKEEEEARKAANSMTVKEHFASLQEGGKYYTASPIFKATLSHIYGENQADATKYDTLSQVASGQLVFQNQEEMDKYLVDLRQKALQGADNFAIAGFDKSWGQFKSAVASANAAQVNKQNIAQAQVQGADNLNAVYKEMQGGGGGDGKVYSAEETVAAVMKRYQVLRETKVLTTPEVQKSTLLGMLDQIAMTGNQEMIQKFLDYKTDAGSVSGIIGGDHAATLTHKAMVIADQNDRKAAQAAMIEAAAKDQARVQSFVSNLLDTNQFLGGAGLTDLKVLQPNGTYKTVNAKELAGELIRSKAAANNATPAQLTKMYMDAGLVNPDDEKIVQTALQGLASIGHTQDGKPVGQLTPQAEAGFKRWLEINAINPRIAEDAAGSLENARFLRGLDVLMKVGGAPNLTVAADTMNEFQARQKIAGGSSGKDRQVEEAVASALGDVVNPGMFGGLSERFRRLFGGDEYTNYNSIRDDLTFLSKVYAGKTGSPVDKVVEQVAGYLAKTTTKIGGTIYYNKDLPHVEPGFDPAKMLESFITEQPQFEAKVQGYTGPVHLEVTPQGTYRAMVGIFPLMRDGRQVIYSRDAIEDWVKLKINADRQNKANERLLKQQIDQGIKPFQERLLKELDGAGPATQFRAADQGVWGLLHSRKGYQRVLQDGNQDKSLQELIGIYGNK